MKVWLALLVVPTVAEDARYLRLEDFVVAAGLRLPAPPAAVDAGSQLQHVRLPASEVMKQWRAAGSPKGGVTLNMTTVFAASRRLHQFTVPITMHFPVDGDVGLSQPIQTSAAAVTSVIDYTAKIGPDADVPMGFLNSYEYDGFRHGTVLVNHVDNESFVFDTRGQPFVQPVTAISRSAQTFFDIDSDEIAGVTCGAVGVYCCASYAPDGSVAAQNSTTPCSTLMRDAVYGMVYRRIIIDLVPDPAHQ